ncbi:hypothetical protein ACIBSV_10255 [Embleya sp. NPDC050154]|uniref:hypothetical protein n=1 Tax=Embleya sp. NPDC050154 TaxID=3363988 RepID=UPI00379D158F
MTFASDHQSPTPTPTPGHRQPPVPTGYFETRAAPPGEPPRFAAPPTHPGEPALARPAGTPDEPYGEHLTRPTPDDRVEANSDNPAETLLRLATTHRTVPEVARMIAILKDCSGLAADDALREAALTRPVSELVLLANLLSNPTHARQGRRPAEQPDPRDARMPVGPTHTGAYPPPPPAFIAEKSPVGAPSRVAEKGAGAGLRWATAVGLAVSGLALGSAIPASVRTPPYAAGWFALLGLTTLFLAGITAVRAGRGMRLAALAAGCATIATALVPPLLADSGAAFEAWGPVALGAGTLTALCAAAFLTRSTAPPDPGDPHREIDFEPWEATMLEHRPASTTRMFG